MIHVPYPIHLAANPLCSFFPPCILKAYSIIHMRCVSNDTIVHCDGIRALRKDSFTFFNSPLYAVAFAIIISLNFPRLSVTPLSLLLFIIYFSVVSITENPERFQRFLINTGWGLLLFNGNTRAVDVSSIVYRNGWERESPHKYTCWYTCTDTEAHMILTWEF